MGHLGWIIWYSVIPKKHFRCQKGRRVRTPPPFHIFCVFTFGDMLVHLASLGNRDYKLMSTIEAITLVLFLPLTFLQFLMVSRS